LPVTHHPYPAARGRRQIMTRRHLVDPFEQSPFAHRRASGVLIKILVVPTSRHSSREQGLYFRGEKKRPLVNSIVTRHDAKSSPGREKRLLCLLVEHQSEFAAQMLNAMHAKFLIQIQGHFAVRARPEKMSASLQLASLSFKIVKLSVHNDMNPAVF